MVDTIIQVVGPAAIAVAGWALNTAYTLKSQVDEQKSELKHLTEIIDLKLTSSTNLIMARFDAIDERSNERDDRLSRIERFLNGHYIAFSAKEQE